MLGKRLGDDGFCIVYSGAPLVESGEEVAVQPRHWTFPQYYVSSYYKGANLVQCDQAINKPTNGSCMMMMRYSVVSFDFLLLFFFFFLPFRSGPSSVFRFFLDDFFDDFFVSDDDDDTDDG